MVLQAAPQAPQFATVLVDPQGDPEEPPLVLPPPEPLPLDADEPLLELPAPLSFPDDPLLLDPEADELELAMPLDEPIVKVVTLLAGSVTVLRCPLES